MTEKNAVHFFGHAHSDGTVAHMFGQESPPMEHEFGSRMRCMSLTNGW